MHYTGRRVGRVDVTGLAGEHPGVPTPQPLRPGDVSVQQRVTRMHDPAGGDLLGQPHAHRRHVPSNLLELHPRRWPTGPLPQISGERGRRPVREPAEHPTLHPLAPPRQGPPAAPPPAPPAPPPPEPPAAPPPGGAQRAPPGGAGGGGPPAAWGRGRPARASPARAAPGRARRNRSVSSHASTTSTRT